MPQFRRRQCFLSIQKPDQINIGDGIIVNMGGKETAGLDNTGGGSVGGGSNDGQDDTNDAQTVPLSIVSINLTIAVGEYVYAGVSSSLSGAVIALSSNNLSIAVVDPEHGTITGAAPGGDVQRLSKTDVLKDMLVNIYMKDPTHIAILVITLM